jgi:hypothetical protein
VELVFSQRLRKPKRLANETSFQLKKLNEKTNHTREAYKRDE